MLLFWLDWPQSLPSASWCVVNCLLPCLLHIPPPDPLPSFPFYYSFFFLSYPIFLLLSMSLGALDSLHAACHCQTSPCSGYLLISHPFPFHSSLNSVNSSDSRGSSGSHSHSPSSSSSSSSSHHLFHHHHARHRYRSSTLPQQAPARLSSISSHDSGFISSSQDQYTMSKSSSPMPAETKVRKKICTHVWNKTIKPNVLYDLKVIVVRDRVKSLNQQSTQLFSHTSSQPLRGS